jgi:predicted transcriptional regulator
MKKITITLTNSNLKNIEELATKLFTSKSAALRLLINNYFKNNLKINNKKNQKNEVREHTFSFVISKNLVEKLKKEDKNLTNAINKIVEVSYKKLKRCFKN